MKISITNRQRDLNLSLPSVRALVCDVLARENIDTDEVIVHFVTIKKISDLHLQFFDDPSPTDCITLPLDGLEKRRGYHVLGEVFICPAVALDYVGGSPAKALIETTLYLVHTLLHLIGYEDDTKKNRTAMRRRERLHMKALQLNSKSLKLRL